MLPPEILNRLPAIAFWMTWAVLVGGFTLTKLAQAGMLGPIGRWFQNRTKGRKKRQDNRDSVNAPDYKALQRRIDALEQLVKKLEAQIIKLQIVEEATAVREDMNAEFLREDAQWHTDASIRAVEQRFSLPPHRSYIQFCRDYRQKHGLQYGRRWNDNPEPELPDWGDE